VPLDLRTLGDLKDALSESNLPFRVDVVDWATTNEGFRKIIEEQKVALEDGTQKKRSIY
jgi:hypothetical protein